MSAVVESCPQHNSVGSPRTPAVILRSNSKHPAGFASCSLNLHGVKQERDAWRQQIAGGVLARYIKTGPSEQFAQRLGA